MNIIRKAWRAFTFADTLDQLKENARLQAERDNKAKRKPAK